MKCLTKETAAVYNFYMNRKSIKDRVLILSLLSEGKSIQFTSKVARCSPNTIMKFVRECGEACSWFQDKFFIDLQCEKILVNEILSFHEPRQKILHNKKGSEEYVWTWTSIDSKTRLIPCWCIGSREEETANGFLSDLVFRMGNRIQICRMNNKKYLEPIEKIIGQNVEYFKTSKEIRDLSERCDLRQSTFSKVLGLNRASSKILRKVQNYASSLAIHFMIHNFIHLQANLKITPAMATGITNIQWDLEKIVSMVDSYWKDK